MRELRAWIILGWRFVLYFAYRLGLRKCPTFLDIYPEGVIVFDRIMNWPKTLRVEGAQNCPSAGPAIFAGNHQKKDDPFVMYRAIHRVTNGSYPVRYMMRDDFFKGLAGIMKSRILDVDELARLVGSLQISRDRVQLSQIKPFITLLREHGSFIMYPGRSRTRTGVFIEYRDNIDEPGGVTFLIAQAQRGRPDLRVPAVPMTRTYNPVTKRSAVIFGEPQYLAHDADRQAQRDMDFKIIELMGGLLEINAAHLVAGILYLRCLHGVKAPASIQRYETAVTSAIERCPNRRIDPALRSDASGETKSTLRYFEEAGLISMLDQQVVPNVEAILHAPEHDKDYHRRNPVKHLVNQYLHLPDVIEAIEAIAGVS